MFRVARLVLVPSCLMLALAGTGPRDSLATTVLVVQVADATTNGFVTDAQVRLPTIGRVARTRWDGEVQFANLDNGKYRIEVRAIGYAPGNVDVALTGDTLPVFFSLERVPATLDTIRIRAERTSRYLREFEERRKRHIGRFFTDSTLMDRRAEGLRMMLASVIPGFTISGNEGRAGGCRVNFFLDGFRISDLDLDALLLDTLAGMEVYTEIEAPVQYKAMSGTCRVVLLWTKW